MQLILFSAAYLAACGAFAEEVGPGLAIVFVIGLLDDLFDLKPLHKIATEIAGAACVYAAGLPYNFARASIFLGDSGSLSIGFLAGVLAMRESRNAMSAADALAPALPLAVPLIEVALSIRRRFLRNAPVFAGDRGHIHHRLLDRGLRPAQVLCGATAGAAVLSLAAPRTGFVLCLLAADPEDCWLAIESAGRALGYGRVEARLRGARLWWGAARRPCGL